MKRRKWDRKKVGTVFVVLGIVLSVLVFRYMSRPGAAGNAETDPSVRSSVSEFLKNADDYPEELVEAVRKNPEMVDFAKDYRKTEKRASGTITKKECSKGIPLFLQWDERWGYVSYGDNMIGLSGCGPTCLSMVATGLTGRKISPDTVARHAMKAGYYQEGSGTSWSLMTEGAKSYGITGYEIRLDRDKVLEELESGHPVICSMRPGDFTTEGHFIVLAGVEDGKIRVHDPNSRQRSNVLWPYEKLEAQIKNLWAYSL